MNNERSRTLKEFKAYIEGFQAGKSGRPPNAIEWTEILAELRHVQVEQTEVKMPLSTPEPWTPLADRFSIPIKLEKDDQGVLVTGNATPKTYGHHR